MDATARDTGRTNAQLQTHNSRGKEKDMEERHPGGKDTEEKDMEEEKDSEEKEKDMERQGKDRASRDGTKEAERGMAYMTLTCGEDKDKDKDTMDRRIGTGDMIRDMAITMA